MGRNGRKRYQLRQEIMKAQGSGDREEGMNSSENLGEEVGLGNTFV